MHSFNIVRPLLSARRSKENYMDRLERWRHNELKRHGRVNYVIVIYVRFYPWPERIVSSVNSAAFKAARQEGWLVRSNFVNNACLCNENQKSDGLTSSMELSSLLYTVFERLSKNKQKRYSRNLLFANVTGRVNEDWYGTARVNLQPVTTLTSTVN